MLLVTCSGISNTGKLTTLAAHTLQTRHPGRFEWIQASRPGTELNDVARTRERILVLDGCEDCCGMKKLAALGKNADVHLVSTTLGIMKNGMAEVTYEEIEIVCRAVAETGELNGIE